MGDFEEFIREHKADLEGVEEQLAGRLAFWLGEIDQDNPTDWYRHVVSKNFGCGCFPDAVWENQIDFRYCIEWRQVKDLIRNIEFAEIAAYEEVKLRWFKTVREAYEIHEKFLKLQDVYVLARLPNEGFSDFMERITP